MSWAAEDTNNSAFPAVEPGFGEDVVSAWAASASISSPIGSSGPDKANYTLEIQVSGDSKSKTRYQKLKHDNSFSSISLISSHQSFYKMFS